MCGEDAEVRKGGRREGGRMEAGKETGSLEKGVAERKGHRVIDGPHTHTHDVRSQAEGVTVVRDRNKKIKQVQGVSVEL